MKTKKTPTTKRTEYVYSYVDTDGAEREEHIIAGEKGVTAEHIAELHALDDKEIYNNTKNRNASLTENINETYENEELVYLDEKALTDLYKSEYNGTQDNFTYFDNVSPEVAKLRELMQKISDFDKKVYKLVVIEERTKTETAEILCVSEGTVRYHLNKIKKFIKNNFLL